MKRFVAGLAVSALVAAGTIVLGQGQGNGNGNAYGQDPFFDKSDNGETIKVLPTPASIHSPRDKQPTLAPAGGGVAAWRHDVDPDNGNRARHRRRV